MIWELPPDLALRCSGCNTVVTDPMVVACPGRVVGDDVDHVLVLPGCVGIPSPDPSEENPFVRYRGFSYSARVAAAIGLTDSEYVTIVRSLDAAVAAVDGKGFSVTPTSSQPALAVALGLPPGVRLWTKDETSNVSGSHKARHLMGIMIHQRVLEYVSRDTAKATVAPLAIASCGNAALGAAVVAAAAQRELLVFVPPSAPTPTLRRLAALGATVALCERRAGEAGDPCVLRYREAVQDGAVPFAVQGPENAHALIGGETIGLELVEQVPELRELYLPVGGGAFAAATLYGLKAAGAQDASVRVHAVQSEGCYPLRGAFRRALALLLADLRPGQSVGTAIDRAIHVLARRRHEAMRPWQRVPLSIATGILDDETYDWQALVAELLRCRGRVIVASERQLQHGNDLARTHTGIDVDPTGSAGLAGVLADIESGHGPRAGAQIAVVFTGSVRCC